MPNQLAPAVILNAHTCRLPSHLESPVALNYSGRGSLLLTLMPQHVEAGSQTTSKVADAEWLLVAHYQHSNGDIHPSHLPSHSSGAEAPPRLDSQLHGRQRHTARLLLGQPGRHLARARRLGQAPLKRQAREDGFHVFQEGSTVLCEWCIQTEASCKDARRGRGTKRTSMNLLASRC